MVKLFALCNDMKWKTLSIESKKSECLCKLAKYKNWKCAIKKSSKKVTETYIAADADVILSGGSNFDLWFDSFSIEFWLYFTVNISLHDSCKYNLIFLDDVHTNIVSIDIFLHMVKSNFLHIRDKFTHLIT